MVRSNAMRPEAMEFRNFASGYGVWLSSTAIDTILATAAQAGSRETGGILIGRYDAEGWMAEITEATSKPRGSRARGSRSTSAYTLWLLSGRRPPEELSASAARAAAIRVG